MLFEITEWERQQFLCQRELDKLVEAASYDARHDMKIEALCELKGDLGCNRIEGDGQGLPDFEARLAVIIAA